MPRRVIFVSGAGLSADSGIRTFRTDTDSGRALWEEYDLEEVCDIGAFQAGYRVRTSPDLPVVGGVDENGMDLYADMAHLFDTLTMQDLVVVVGCSNQVINFNWELFTALSMGTKMVVVNPGVNYEETLLYEDRGVFVYREKAATAFSNEGFIKMVEDHLNK